MRLIRQKYNYHVSLDTVAEFEEIILSDPSLTSTSEIHRALSKAMFFTWKTLSKHNFLIKRNLYKSAKLKRRSQTINVFSVLMGTDFSKCLPFFILPGNKSIFMFDAWPKDHDRIIKFINAFKIKNVFFSASQAVEMIQPKTKNTNCFWVPEGISPNYYKYYSYQDKTIDVLALGRRYDAYHDSTEPYLAKKGINYLYEKEKGKLIFPTREDMLDGFAKSKISICVPSSITHPDRSGNIETMTIRYLQSMVSKCIILGHAPKEMVTLFGYNPVIEIDLNDPEGQIESILNNYSDYFPLVEKNYQTVLNNHTWNNRWSQIKNIINDC